MCMSVQTMLTAVATFALSAILNSNLIKNPDLWSAERLTAAGKAFVLTSNLSSFVGSDLAVPFFKPDRQPSWDVVSTPTKWHFSNLVNFVGRDFAAKSFFTGGSFFHVIFNLALISVVAVILSFLVIHLFWMALGGLTNYPELSNEARLITSMHSLFAVMTAVQLVPYTYYLLPLFFGPDVLGQLQKSYTVLFSFFILHGVMYVCEAAARVSLKTNHLLIWHHILWFVFIFIASVKESVFAIKLDFILDYMVCWEFGLYIVLVAHRLGASRIFLRRLLVLAFVTYGGSRIVQFVLVLALFI